MIIIIVICIFSCFNYRLNEKERYTFIDATENGALKTFNDMCNLIPRYEQFSLSWAEPITPIKVNISLFFRINVI